MLVENQIVEINKNKKTQDWYEKLGYDFSKQGNTILVKAEDLSCGSTALVQCECDYCHNIISIPYHRYLTNTKNKTVKFSCKECKGKKKSEYRSSEERQFYYDQFIKLCESKNYIPLSQPEDYFNRTSKLKYICPLHGVHETTLTGLRYFNCVECGYIEQSRKKTLSKEKVIEIVSNKNNDVLLNPNEYVSVKTPNLRIKCGSCDSEFTASLESIISGGGRCKKCGTKQASDAQRLDIDIVKNTIESINNNKFLNPESYSGVNVKNLKIQCGNCGKIFLTSYANFKKNPTGRCPDCNNMSMGEFLIAEFLDFYNIDYQRQYKFEDCVDKLPLPFDFYLSGYNLCIEFDGQHHYSPIWGESRYKITKRHDKIKNEYCRQNGIDLLRIPYWERRNLEEIIRDKLGLAA